MKVLVTTSFLWLYCLCSPAFAQTLSATQSIEKGYDLLKKAKLALGEEQNILLRQAVSAFDAAISTEDTRYEAHDMKGQCYELLHEPKGAYQAYERAVQLFEVQDHAMPDLHAPAMCYRMGRIAAENTHTRSEALLAAYKGQNMLRHEWRKATDSRDEYTVRQWSDIQILYSSTRQDLRSLEMDLYIADKNLRASALPRFEADYHTNPNSEIAAITYLMLVTEEQPDTVFTLYDALLTRFPESASIRFCLGLFYVRIADGYYAEYEKTSNDDDYRQFQDAYKSGYDTIQAAYILAPNDITILEELIKIASDLGDERYPFYKLRLQELSK
jgi:hypothetical protein